jgi:hypothetical protein
MGDLVLFGCKYTTIERGKERKRKRHCPSRTMPFGDSVVK